MKTIEIDDELYAYIASQTKYIGESASQILRRVLMGEPARQADEQPQADAIESTENVQTEALNAESLNQTKVAPAVAGNNVLKVLEEQDISALGSRVEQFLAILGAMHTVHADNFDRVLAVKGRNRLYFAQDKQQLLASGSSTNPKQIPGSGFWVVTNNNTQKKVSMLSQAASALGYSDNEVEQIVALFESA